MHGSLEALAGVAPSQVRDFANRQGLSFGKLTKNAPPVPALAASTDTDADGLTDLEETSGINDPATVIDPRGHVTNPASADTDGDGTSDGVEARLNTNPLDGGDYFQPLILRTASGEPTLTWPSATGTSFTVERSTSLLGWSQIATNLVGQPGHTSYTDTAAPAAAAQLFYRVRLD